MKFIITVTLIVAVSALPQPHIKLSPEDDSHINFRHWEPTPDLWRLSKLNKDVNIKVLQDLLSQLASFENDFDVENGKMRLHDALNALKNIQQFLINKNDEENEVVPNDNESENEEEAIPPNDDVPEDDKEDPPVNDEIENDKDIQQSVSALDDEPVFSHEATSLNENVQNVLANKKIILGMMKPEIVQVASQNEEDDEKQRSKINFTPRPIQITPLFTSDGIEFIPSYKKK